MDFFSQEYGLPIKVQFSLTSRMNNPAVKIFLSYAHEDEPLRNALVRHLKLLENQGGITIWHDRKILPGAEWQKAWLIQILYCHQVQSISLVVIKKMCKKISFSTEII